MRTRLLPIGISFAALAAASAAAQTTTDAAGNTESIQCSVGSSCDVDNQVTGNDRNNGTVEANGTENDALITQRGDDNSSLIRISGNVHDAEITQQGIGHFGQIIQTGDDQNSAIFQGAFANSATVSQVGSGMSSGIVQGSFFGLTPPVASGNVVSVSQNGTGLNSTIDQYAPPRTGSANENSATVIQTGVQSSSSIAQFSSGNVAIVRMAEGSPFVDFRRTGENRSTVRQEGGSSASNPLTGNYADVAIRGEQNSSEVRQAGLQHRAIVSMLGGAAGLTSSAPVDPAGAGRTLPADRPLGNNSYAEQTGRGNSFEISSGGAANASTANGRGNSSHVIQRNDVLANGHRSTVYQRGFFDSVAITQIDNSATTAQTVTNSNGIQSASSADVSQLSFNSSATIRQSGTNSAIVTQGTNRNVAPNTPTELGGNNTITIQQTDAGDATTGGVTSIQSNFAEVAQYGRQNNASVTQDALDARATVFQPVGSRGNNATIYQGTGPGTNGSATPGTGANARNLAADVVQSGRGSSATITQLGLNQIVNLVQRGNLESAGSANVAGISQSNANNRLTLVQDGNNLTAGIQQRGSGTASLANRVTIEQTGDRHNASVIQEAGVTASGDAAPGSGEPGMPGARAAGAQSAEIQIIQKGSRTASDTTSTGNRASVRQEGAGQFARIVQEGRANTAGILQGPLGVNATAIIEQTGDGNSFYITQNAPGQFMRVIQNGGGNIITNQASGPAGGGVGSNTGQPPL